MFRITNKDIKKVTAYEYNFEVYADKNKATIAKATDRFFDLLIQEKIINTKDIKEKEYKDNLSQLFYGTNRMTIESILKDFED